MRRLQRQCPHRHPQRTPAPVTHEENRVATVAVPAEAVPPMAGVRVKVEAKDARAVKAEKAAVVHAAKAATVKCVVKAAMASVATKNRLVKPVSMAGAKVRVARKVRTAAKAATATVATTAARHPLLTCLHSARQRQWQRPAKRPKASVASAGVVVAITAAVNPRSRATRSPRSMTRPTSHRPKCRTTRPTWWGLSKEMPTTPSAHLASAAAVIVTAVTAASVLHAKGTLQKAPPPRHPSKPRRLWLRWPRQTPTGRHAATSASLRQLNRHHWRP